MVMLIVIAICLVISMTMLRINVHIRTYRRVMINFRVRIPIHLLNFIAMVFIIKRRLTSVILRPSRPSRIPSIMMIRYTTRQDIRLLVPMIRQRCTTTGIVIRLLLPSRITFFRFLSVMRGQVRTVLFRTTVLFVLLVMTIPLYVVRYHVRIPYYQRDVVRRRLVIRLRMIIHLIFMGTSISIIVYMRTT